MRIIAGRFRGRTLVAPKGSATRPTADSLREALFNLLTSRVTFEGARVLDLFAGTGALGLEALSRGAASAVFVEQAEPALRVARANAHALGVTDVCTFVRADAAKYLRTPGAPFDLILADPPYAWPALPTLPPLVHPWLAEDGLFALEHDTRHDFSEAPGLVLTRAYGRTVVSLFEDEPGEDAAG